MNPLGIESLPPQLSWVLQARQRGQQQTAYRILAASNPQFLAQRHGDLWDSGKVYSDESVHVLYAGKTLHAQQQLWWQVQAWDKDHKPTAWSEPASWTMGLLHLADWQAQWITSASANNGTPSPLFRHEFSVAKPLKRAVAYICGLGYSELYLNGRKVGDHVLDPAQTDYEQRALYVTYDVTHLLKRGTNAVGVMLGNGFFNQEQVWGGMSYGKPQLILQMQLEYADGTLQTVLSDGTWRTTVGPIMNNNVYEGEVYDARHEIPHWCEAGYEDASWKSVQVVPPPTAQLVSQTMPPIKRLQTLTPVRLLHPHPQLYIYDMGQNFAGWARLRVQAPAGTEIKLRFAEAIHPDGTLDMGSTGVFATHVEQTDRYICKGGGVETWEPRFTYHGFRYVELSGFVQEPRLEDLQGVVVHTAVEPTGFFQCSDATLNHLHQVALWTELSNLHSIPTDCPAREKCGWLGDAHISAEMTIYNFDMAQFWPKYIGDIQTSWRGDLPGDVAPGKRGIGPNGHLDWGVASVLLPWYEYLYYGDKRLLRAHYPAMRKFIRNARPLGPDGIFSKGYGDWCPPGSVEPVETPPALTTTAYLYRAAQVMTQVAHILGEEQESQEFASLQDRIKQAFNTHFYQASTHTYGSQTADSIALAFGLTPAGAETAVAASLAYDVLPTHQGHLATGIFGSRYLYGILSRYGYGAVAQGILHQTTYPSFGDLFTRGATTFWECWGEPELDQKWGPRSQNHAMQGAFDAWFYQDVAGIHPSPDEPGFKHIVLRPTILPGLHWARATYRSPYGLVESAWNQQGRTLQWHVSIPVNTEATVYLPATNPLLVTESGRLAAQAPGVRYLGSEAGVAIYKITSGSYHFIMTFGPMDI
ncbi:MAG: family 78 glycoside hydrolase catalytic domain [Abitibacteriaceae bacterium]|nr:family 78 glycoside hydrolase catalytic domain [Abditibacteriaceae bacterium]MBV9868049.1 family 78 glycoside hydrolase catalytic domain [Abditibacteriaceae bacterium]